MRQVNKQRVLRSLKWCAIGSASVGVVTLVGVRLHLDFITASFCYLLLLVLQSLPGEIVSSVLVAMLSVGCLDFFFVPPVGSFQVASPLDILGLLSFLATGVIIAWLVTAVRAKTEISRLQHHKLQRLYDLAQELLALEPAARGTEFLAPFCGVFGIKTVCLFDALSAEVHIAGNPRSDLEEKTGEAFVRAKDCDYVSAAISVRCIRVAGRTIGAIGFDGLEDPDLVARPLAALAAAHLERTHSFANASRAAATAQTESYRGAILDALAHEFKTPLSTILAAAGSLRDAGSLGPHQREMAETVESEAARLGRLTSRLIRTARLEREEVKPWMELIDLAAVLSDTVEQYAKWSADRRISVVQECDSCEVLADPELLRLAVSQLLDNACKYSVPGSTITLSIGNEQGSIALRVLSHGNPIPVGEKHKIFERFYRGIDGRRMGPGSGLGLYVARKISLALGGDLELDTESGSGEGTTFRLTLPVPQNERRDLATAV